ncbi:hypothetical protein H0H93_009204 [Arthromyces matolae]|nr:hypothetical protein H0H93_009204 [Arthromyces matolae]
MTPKTFSMRKTILQGTGLLSVLLRDGTMYFAVIIVSNVGSILSFIVRDSHSSFFPIPNPLFQDYTRGIPTPFTNIISSIMISRLMLNLRDPKLTGLRVTNLPTGKQDTTVRFRTGTVRDVTSNLSSVPEEKPDQMDESAPWMQSQDGFISEWYPSTFTPNESRVSALSEWSRIRENRDLIPLGNVSQV